MTEFQELLIGWFFAIFNEMKNQATISFSNKVIVIPIFLVIIIWFVYWVEIRFSLNFTKFGILPRQIIGLSGIVCSPFIHSDAKHLLNNSVPLLVLTTVLIYFYRDVYKKVLLFGGFLSGFLTWLIAREAYHIGASGIIYLLFSFVFFSGIIKRQFQLVAVSLIIIFLYGSMVWYVLPIEEGVSWEGHLSGFIVGLILSLVYRKRGLINRPYEFKETEFDSLFDENGNFNPPKSEVEEE